MAPMPTLAGGGCGGWTCGWPPEGVGTSRSSTAAGFITIGPMPSPVTGGCDGGAWGVGQPGSGTVCSGGAVGFVPVSPTGPAGCGGVAWGDGSCAGGVESSAPSSRTESVLISSDSWLSLTLTPVGPNVYGRLSSGKLRSVMRHGQMQPGRLRRVYGRVVAPHQHTTIVDPQQGFPLGVLSGDPRFFRLLFKP